MADQTPQLTSAQQEILRRARREAEGKPYLQQLAMIALALIEDTNRVVETGDIECSDTGDKDHNVDPSSPVLAEALLPPLPPPLDDLDECFLKAPPQTLAQSPPRDLGDTPHYAPDYDLPPLANPSVGQKTRPIAIPIITISPPTSDTDYDSDATETASVDSQETIEAPEPSTNAKPKPIAIVIHFADGTAKAYPPSILAGIQTELY